MDKKSLRRKYLQLKKQLSDEAVYFKSESIIEKLMALPCYQHASTIMTYIDFNHEVMTRAFISNAIKNRKKIVVPITDTTSHTLILSELKDMDRELEVSSYGILEPKKEYIRKVDVRQLDVILVPAVLYDVLGYRIGYGGGYYDRLLCNVSNNAYCIGLAFAYQVIEHIPCEEHDQKVDMIITEKGIIKNEYKR